MIFQYIFKTLYIYHIYLDNLRSLQKNVFFVLNNSRRFKYTHELRYADSPNPSFVPIKILQSHT